MALSEIDLSIDLRQILDAWDRLYGGYNPKFVNSILKMKGLSILDHEIIQEVWRSGPIGIEALEASYGAPARGYISRLLRSHILKYVGRETPRMMRML